MKTQDMLRKLEWYGTEQNRKVYRRHGAGDNQFGVSFANLHKLAKQIGHDSDMAEMLWRSGNHDARILACMVVDGKLLAEETLDRWVKDLDNYIITDAFSETVSRTPFFKSKVEKWIGSEEEWISAAGWNLISHLAMKDQALDDEYFLDLLGIIEDSIHQKPNRTCYSMNNALIAIGIRNPSLGEKAKVTALRIGVVQVDHGATACKTTDALAYIEKTMRYRSAKLSKI